MFFAFFNGYSGLGFYATLLDMFFNAAWTSWPVLLSTPQDRIIEKKTIYANPTGTHPPLPLSVCPVVTIYYASVSPTTVYQHAVKGNEFNIKTFISIMILAVFHAAVNFFVPSYALDLPAGTTSYVSVCHSLSPSLTLSHPLSLTLSLSPSPSYAPLPVSEGEHQATPGLWVLSTVSFTCVVLTVTVELAIRTVCYFR